MLSTGGVTHHQLILLAKMTLSTLLSTQKAIPIINIWAFKETCPLCWHINLNNKEVLSSCWILAEIVIEQINSHLVLKTGIDKVRLCNRQIWLKFLLNLFFSLVSDQITLLVDSNKLIVYIKKDQVRFLWCTMVSTAFGGAQCFIANQELHVYIEGLWFEYHLWDDKGFMRQLSQ